MKKTLIAPDATQLRREAEKRLKKQQLTSVPHTIEADTLKLIHELEVHQIELEMQNEELILAKESAVVALDKYIELYDFSPSCHVTLDSRGKIERISLAGATMLGKERTKLFYDKFNIFVTEQTLPAFNDFFKRIFESKKRETCQVDLIRGGAATTPVFIAGIASEDGKLCYLTVIDVSELKKI